MTKFPYVTWLSFKESYELEHGLKGGMKIGSDTDKWEFTGEALNIEFERINPIVPDYGCLSSSELSVFKIYSSSFMVFRLRLQKLIELFYTMLDVTKSAVLMFPMDLECLSNMIKHPFK